MQASGINKEEGRCIELGSKSIAPLRLPLDAGAYAGPECEAEASDSRKREAQIPALHCAGIGPAARHRQHLLTDIQVDKRGEAGVTETALVWLLGLLGADRADGQCRAVGQESHCCGVQAPGEGASGHGGSPEGPKAQAAELTPGCFKSIRSLRYFWRLRVAAQ